MVQHQFLNKENYIKSKTTKFNKDPIPLQHQSDILRHHVEPTYFSSYSWLSALAHKAAISTEGVRFTFNNNKYIIHKIESNNLNQQYYIIVQTVQQQRPINVTTPTQQCNITDSICNMHVVPFHRIICHNWTCQAIKPLIVVPNKAIVVPYFQANASYAYVLNTTMWLWQQQRNIDNTMKQQ